MNHLDGPRPARSGQTADATPPWRAIAFGLVVALAACSKPASSPPSASPSEAAARPAVKPPTSVAPVPELPATVRQLLGRWMRADGGYTLELRRADLSGVVDAGYFNPKSIHVSRAVWMQGGGGFQVAVELNDVGYPGATYLLNYDSKNDRLVGKYTQPAMQQSFDIEFVRQPK